MAAPPRSHIDSTVHMDFAVGLGQLGLSWMYDIVIIIIIIILPCGVFLVCHSAMSILPTLLPLSSKSVPGSCRPQDVPPNFLFSDSLFLSAQNIGEDEKGNSSVSCSWPQPSSSCSTAHRSVAVSASIRDPVDFYT